MNEQEKITRLKNRDIDYAKWDHCIAHASNGNLYAKSWYLDVVSPDWEALVMGDYRFVMPLTVVRKLGISFLIQPLHCQQLGIFPPPAADVQKKFALRVYKAFLLVRYQLNAGMLQGAFDKFSIIKKPNYLLPLYDRYEQVVEGFSSHTARNIKISNKEGVNIVRGLLPSDYLREKVLHVTRNIPGKSNQLLNYIMVQSVTRGTGVIYAAYSRTNTLCAAAFFIFEQDKAYYLNAFSSEEGKKNRAMYAIVNAFLRDYSGNLAVLDFEGSVLEGVARFYKGFGAEQEDYFLIKSTKLPLMHRI